MHLKTLPLFTRTHLFWIKHIFPALVFASLMLLVYPSTQWDINITDVFYDAQQHFFPLKHNVFLSQWMHVGLKWLMVIVALICLGLYAIGGRLAQLKPYRMSFLWVFIGMVLSTSSVSVLKHYSMHGCPWDLTLYGGELPLLGLFETPPIGIEAGACFPAGHPSGGFALMAFYFAFMLSRPYFAKVMLLVGMVMGLAMGGVQVMRGAHFLSHILWSGWVVWVVLLALELVKSVFISQSYRNIKNGLITKFSR